MIPDFTDDGYLPPGVYLATLAEIEGRFGRESEIRQAQLESIQWLVELARRAGIQRIVLNGSFVTDIIEPNDVDCVLLYLGQPKDRNALRELQTGLPFMDIAIVRSLKRFDEYISRIFGIDRFRTPRGIIEVIEWI